MNLASSRTEGATASLPGAVSTAVAGVLLLTAFWPILTGMFASWFIEPANMEHGVLVIPAAAYMAWRKRAKLAQVPRSRAFWGVILVFWGAAQAMFGMAAHWVWVSRSAFLLSLTGCIAALYGGRMVRELGYPLCTLLLMIAPPSFLYERFTLNLQLLAGRLGADCLEVVGYPVLREGNILEMVGIKLSVEEACSGLRSLVSILFLCVVYNYFFVRGNGTRALILFMAVPIAIAGNVVRIVMTGIASQYNRQLAYGTAHEALGYVTVLVAGIACIAFHVVVTKVQKAWRSHQA